MFKILLVLNEVDIGRIDRFQVILLIISMQLSLSYKNISTCFLKEKKKCVSEEIISERSQDTWRLVARIFMCQLCDHDQPLFISITI